MELSKEYNKMSKCNHREIYMKAPFIIYADMESTSLQNVHLMQQKICLIVIEVKIVWKGFVRV